MAMGCGICHKARGRAHKPALLRRAGGWQVSEAGQNRRPRTAWPGRHGTELKGSAMGKMGKYVVLLVVLGWLGPAGAALAAENLTVDAFYGTWKGSGEAHSPGNYFALTARDLDVRIEAKGAGFSVAWTTVTHPGGEGSTAKIKRKSSTIDFLPGGKPGVFKAARPGDPLAGEAYAWARIKGQTLSVYLLSIDEHGAYVIQSYDRTLTGFAMELTFARIRDDEPERTARGKLVKVAD